MEENGLGQFGEGNCVAVIAATSGNRLTGTDKTKGSIKKEITCPAALLLIRRGQLLPYPFQQSLGGSNSFRLAQIPALVLDADLAAIA